MGDKSRGRGEGEETGTAERKANTIQIHHPIFLQHSLFGEAGRAGSGPDPTLCGTKHRLQSQVWTYLVRYFEFKVENRLQNNPKPLGFSAEVPPQLSHPPQAPEHSQRAKSVETFIKHKAQRNTSLLNGSKSESASPARPRGTPGPPHLLSQPQWPGTGEPQPKGCRAAQGGEGKPGDSVRCLPAETLPLDTSVSPEGTRTRSQGHQPHPASSLLPQPPATAMAPPALFWTQANPGCAGETLVAPCVSHQHQHCPSAPSCPLHVLGELHMP